MNIEKFIQGESKRVEFQEILPNDSQKYMKTVVAFANTQGGWLIIGINDRTREIIGVNEDDLFDIMDSIANAISNSCEPQIEPEIWPYSIEGKTIIVVRIPVGMNRPYYLKSKGINGGTYIRVGATSRLASASKIKDLMMEGSKVSWDELRCLNYAVTEERIHRLCEDINRYRKERSLRKKGKVDEDLQPVTVTNLENWNLLKKEDEEYVATNAFALLTGDHFYYSRTQCGVFLGTDRGDFLDKQDYDGPIYEQIEKACAFVLRNIRRSAKVLGLIRRESLELPVDAIREMHS